MVELIGLSIVVVIGSAFFSGLEAALFAVPMSRVHVLVEQNKRGAHALEQIKASVSRPVIVIVIFNNIINIVGSIFVGAVATHVFGSSLLGIVSAVLTIAIIIFGEIVPKTLGENNAESIALFFSTPLLWATKIFAPIIWALEHVTKPFIRDKQLVSEDELRILSSLGHTEGSIERDEHDMIQNVFRLNDLSAEDIMTPRNVVDALPADGVLADLKEAIYEFGYSRIPVYEGTLDHITHVCSRMELLTALAKNKETLLVKDFSIPILVVHEDTKVDTLLPLFQRERQHMAVVEDEFGTMRGIVTLEDALEELVGEIVDETDEFVDLRKEARKRSQYKEVAGE